MDFVRTPDQRFDNLEGYPYEPNYVQIDDTEGGSLRLHYVDTGPSDGPVCLLMHGQPVWGYLYRHMIPALVAEGFRVIVPDLIGFGRSDKPTKQEDYTYARHVAWMSDWLTQLDLNDVTVFFQDWGSLIGLRLVAAFPERFSRVVLANGGLPTGLIPSEFSAALKEAYKTLPVVPGPELGSRFADTSGIPGFLYWRKYAAESEEMVDMGRFISLMTIHGQLTEGETRAFSAPFPDDSYLAGARRFPQLVPIMEDEPEVPENKAAWEVLKTFDKPFLLAFSDMDPVTAGMDQLFLDAVPGCKGQPHRTISPAGHFLQQEQPEQCVKAIMDVCAGD